MHSKMKSTAVIHILSQGRNFMFEIKYTFMQMVASFNLNWCLYPYHIFIEALGMLWSIYIKALCRAFYILEHSQVSCTAWSKSRSRRPLQMPQTHRLPKSKKITAAAKTSVCSSFSCTPITLHSVCLGRIYRATKITHTQMFECFSEAFKAWCMLL